MQNTINSIQEDVTTLYKKISKLENKMDYIIELLEFTKQKNCINAEITNEKEESQEREQYVEIKNKTFDI